MRTVLITGGSRGIGAACVKRFAAAGDRVYFLYAHSDAAAQAVEQQTGATALRCDVRSRDRTREVIAGILAERGCVDVLVNNAGISQFALFQDLTEEDWGAMMQVHLGGAVRCTQAVLPEMIRRKEGCVLNVSSMWGQVGASCETHYSAAKAALIGLTKALAKEVGPSGIRVNCVAPGVISTDMNASLTADALNELRAETPLCRLGTEEEVAGVLFWLASDEASFVTGQVLGVNGGLIL